MSGLLIKIDDKTYHSAGLDHQAIAGLELRIPRHQFACLVGPSGCGKTTLLNIIAGLDRDYQGKISSDAGEQAPSVGYVFQNPRLLPWSTVRQNIELVFPHTPPAALIDELLAEGYDPKLDDGVGKNIAPLQKKGIIAYEVLNPGQLKKYLNADW